MIVACRRIAGGQNLFTQISLQLATNRRSSRPKRQRQRVNLEKNNVCEFYEGREVGEIHERQAIASFIASWGELQMTAVVNQFARKFYVPLSHDGMISGRTPYAG